MPIKLRRQKEIESEIVNSGVNFPPPLQTKTSPAIAGFFVDPGPYMDD